MSHMKRRDSARSAVKRYLQASMKHDESYNKQQIISYVELLEEQWARFKSAQDKVEESCGSDETLKHEELEREQAEKWYIEAKANFKNMNEFSEPTQKIDSNATEGNVSFLPNIKLPKFDLPKFSGDPTTWMSFFDSFDSVIIKNESLTGSQRLHYLRNCLSCEPLKLIANYKLEDCNFAIAWQLLITRYNVPRVIKDHHFSAIFAVQKVNVDTAAAIKSVLDPVMQNIQALKSLKLPVSYWDDWLIHIIVHRLAYETRRQWELTISDDKTPSLRDLQEFLENRCRSLEILTTNNKQLKTNASKGSKPHLCLATQAKDFRTRPCLYCSGNHKIYHCTNFRTISVEDRQNAVRGKGACTNCLSVQHMDDKCQSTSTCRICNQRHHTLLHFNSNTNVAIGSTVNANNSLINAENPTTTTLSTNANKSVLLATALIKAYSSDGKQHILRALLDNGSQASLITDACAQKLKLLYRRSPVTVNGIGLSRGNTKGETTVMISPINGSEIYTVHPIILAKLTGPMPTVKITTTIWPHIKGLTLADPQFYNPARVDLIIGADKMTSLLEPNLIKGEPGTPLAQKTAFGWVLFGEAKNKVNRQELACLCTNLELTKIMMKAWELDEMPEKHYHTPEEEACEAIFNSSYKRDKDGRITVQLPLKPNMSLGESRSVAIQSWLRMENRLRHNDELRISYNTFLQEMLDQGHMELAPSYNTKNYYMPHHSVVKDTSLTTKVRIVFNASQKTSNGYSLNNVLMVGPQLQQDLPSILNRFQSHRYAMISDVAAMYRQVKIDEKHTDYHRIVWRKSPLEPIQDYRMLRVTYGVASSAHHAVKALQQTALDFQSKYPLASSKIINDFYMDDLLTGLSSEHELVILRKQISEILSSGCFELRKWASNSPLVLQNIPAEAQQHKITHLLAEDDVVRALGLMWNSKEDYLYFSLSLDPPPNTLTKRLLLSDACRLFDPTGKVSPVTVVPKMLFQHLWKLKIDWDEQVPQDIASYWLDYREGLKVLNTLRIPRWLGTGEKGSVSDLHCFADASEVAYAGVIYVRTEHADGSITVALLSAKTKVAPLRTVSIAKLELCAATLVCSLAKQVLKSLGTLIRATYGWTDSMNTLAWLQSHPSRWSVFVANRVAKAQSTIDSENWSHIATECNPADCASRGIHPTKLIKYALW